jgi:hypothetical protein
LPQATALRHIDALAACRRLERQEGKKEGDNFINYLGLLYLIDKISVMPSFTPKLK